LLPLRRSWQGSGRVVCGRRRKLGSDFSVGRRIVALASPLLSGRAIDCASGRILDLNVFLSPREDITHLGDFVLHQILVKGASDL